MGIHSFSGFETPSDAMVEARREMWLWAEPIIADRAIEGYDAGLSNRVASNIMARKHCRLWRAVIHDQVEEVQEVSEDLRDAGDRFGMDRQVVDEVNTAVLDELVDVVLARYRASRHATKAFSMVLMSATSRLGSLRAAA